MKISSQETGGHVCGMLLVLHNDNVSGHAVTIGYISVTVGELLSNTSDGYAP